LYKTLKPLATGLVKRQIQKAIRDAVTTGLEYLDGQLVGVRDKMEAAKSEEKDGVETKSRMQILHEVRSRIRCLIIMTYFRITDVPEEGGN
jgi:hypothetical protein